MRVGIRYNLPSSLGQGQGHLPLPNITVYCIQKQTQDETPNIAAHADGGDTIHTVTNNSDAHISTLQVSLALVASSTRTKWQEHHWNFTKR